MSDFIKALFDISIYHLTEETRRRMDADARNYFMGKPCSLPFTIKGSSFGWFIDVRSAAERHCATKPYPSDIVECYELALSMGCEYILFDRDAERHEGLAWYGDESQLPYIEPSQTKGAPKPVTLRHMLLNDLASDFPGMDL
ncbi:MAG: hypothetical protein WD046_14340 [Paracoccaceae bacterium]